MTQAIEFGFGAVRRLRGWLERFRIRRVFLVTGGDSYERSGAREFIDTQLHDVDSVCRFCEFSENPCLPDVLRGLSLFEASRSDGVVAVGGGSVLDMAKLVNALAHQPADPADVIRGVAPITIPGVPLIAVPTTSGSGSEATHFAVAYIERTKFSLASEALLPAVAIIDPGLASSMGPRLTAVSGIDALSQAIESFWSVNSTNVSKSLSRKAILLALRYLSRAVNAPSPEARRGMSKAAYLAGRAINITKTTGAHALSYSLTSHFHIPHGEAVALTLGEWIVFNAAVTDEDVTDPRGAAYVQATMAELATVMGCAAAWQCRDLVAALQREVGLTVNLRERGISKEHALGIVVPNVNAERLGNNPRRATASDIRRIVEAVC